jgi:hypothetical protein
LVKVFSEFESFEDFGQVRIPVVVVRPLGGLVRKISGHKAPFYRLFL